MESSKLPPYCLEQEQLNILELPLLLPNLRLTTVILQTGI